VLAVIVTASARLPPTLARHAAGRFGHGCEASLSDGSTAHLARSVGAPIAKLCGMPGLLLAGGSDALDRFVGFLGAHPLRGVGVSEAPAHDDIVRLLAKREVETAGD
jgi:hypothetical protein